MSPCRSTAITLPVPSISTFVGMKRTPYSSAAPFSPSVTAPTCHFQSRLSLAIAAFHASRPPMRSRLTLNTA